MMFHQSSHSSVPLQPLEPGFRNADFLEVHIQLSKPIPGVNFTCKKPKLNHIFCGLEETHTDLGDYVKREADAGCSDACWESWNDHRRRKGTARGKFGREVWPHSLNAPSLPQPSLRHSARAVFSCAHHRSISPCTTLLPRLIPSNFL